MNSTLEGYADKVAAAQGSGEWLNARLGHCTASRFSDVMDFTKAGKEGAKRKAYRMELVIERITSVATERFVSNAMMWGTDKEPLARMAYESATGAIVETTGFILHPIISMCGGSPDGLVDDNGMVEFKCPESRTHVETILSGECDYLPQVQGLLWITGRQWCHFVSYDPRLPPGLSVHIQRIARDDQYIAKLADAVIVFLREVEEMQRALLAIAKENAPKTEVEPDNLDWRTGDVPPLEL